MSQNYVVAICTRGHKLQNLEKLFIQIENEFKNNSVVGRILLVVNSTDKPRLRARESLDVVLEPEVGYAAVRNAALRHRKNGETLIFVDDDESIGVDWLSSFCKYSDRFPNSVLVGPPITVDEFGRRLTTPYRTSLNSIPSGTKINFGCTGNMMIPRSVFETTAVYFDPFFNRGGEDTDLVIRLKSRGISTIWVNEAQVFEETPTERLNLDWVQARRNKAEAIYAISGMRNFGAIWGVYWLLTLSMSYLLNSITRRRKGGVRLDEPPKAGIRALLKPNGNWMKDS